MRHSLLELFQGSRIAVLHFMENANRRLLQGRFQIQARSEFIQVRLGNDVFVVTGNISERHQQGQKDQQIGYRCQLLEKAFMSVLGHYFCCPSKILRGKAQRKPIQSDQ